MATRTIKSHPGRGTVSRTKLRAAIKAVRSSTKASKIVVSKSNPITSAQTASGRKLIAFKVAKDG